METRTTHRLYIASMLVLLMAFLLMGYVTYLMFEPFHEPLVVEPFPVLNENKEVVRGELLYYTIQLTKYQDIPVSSFKSIVCADGNLVTLAFAQTSLPLGTHKLDTNVRIPEKTSLGECYLHFETTFHVNKLKDVHRERNTEVFYVIEK